MTLTIAQQILKTQMLLSTFGILRKDAYKNTYQIHC